MYKNIHYAFIYKGKKKSQMVKQLTIFYVMIKFY